MIPPPHNKRSSDEPEELLARCPVCGHPIESRPVPEQCPACGEVLTDNAEVRRFLQ